MLPEPDNRAARLRGRPDSTRFHPPALPLSESPAPPPAQHLLLPHASAMGEPAAAALKALRLPNLEALLAQLAPAQQDDGDEYSRTPPHERRLAQLYGWQGEDGRWPFAAHHAAGDGLPGSDQGAWALVTPVHWHVGSDQISLLDPALLNLGEAESRALLEIVRPSFEEVGWRVHWGAPLRWYAQHEGFAGMEAASLERAIGRNLDLWISDHPAARTVRRLQVEAQMLWHGHAVNDAREARRELPVNSFWLSGCGAAQPARPPTGLRVDDRLRAPLLAGEWEAWVAAWAELDAGPIAELRAAADRGEALQLTLCGERHSRSWQTAPRGLLQRWFGPKRHDALPVLTEL